VKRRNTNALCDELNYPHAFPNIVDFRQNSQEMLKNFSLLIKMFAAHYSASAKCDHTISFSTAFCFTKF